MVNKSRGDMAYTLVDVDSPVTEPALAALRAEIDGIDDQILAARLAMRVLDKTSSELNELRLRVQHLERRRQRDRALHLVATGQPLRQCHRVDRHPDRELASIAQGDLDAITTTRIRTERRRRH